MLPVPSCGGAGGEGGLSCTAVAVLSTSFCFLFFKSLCYVARCIPIYEGTSARHPLFKYVKLQRGRRCNTVPGSQITICGGVVFLLITPCEMKNAL